MNAAKLLMPLVNTVAHQLKVATLVKTNMLDHLLVHHVSQEPFVYKKKKFVQFVTPDASCARVLHTAHNVNQISLQFLNVTSV